MANSTVSGDPLVRFQVRCTTHRRWSKAWEISKLLVTDRSVDVVGYLSRAALIGTGCDQNCEIAIGRRDT